MPLILIKSLNVTPQFGKNKHQKSFLSLWNIIFEGIDVNFFSNLTSKVMSKNSNVVLGIITAAAAGAVIGMLFAPDKGTELRDKVRGTEIGRASCREEC